MYYFEFALLKKYIICLLCIVYWTKIPISRTVDLIMLYLYDYIDQFYSKFNISVVYKLDSRHNLILNIKLYFTCNVILCYSAYIYFKCIYNYF